MCTQLSGRPSQGSHTHNARAPVQPKGPGAPLCVGAWERSGGPLLSALSPPPTTSHTHTAPPPLPARLAATAAAALITLGGAGPALAAMRLPPIDNGESGGRGERGDEREGRVAFSDCFSPPPRARALSSFTPPLSLLISLLPSHPPQTPTAANGPSPATPSARPTPSPTGSWTCGRASCPAPNWTARRCRAR